MEKVRASCLKVVKIDCYLVKVPLSRMLNYFRGKNEFCSFLIQIFYYFKVMERTPLESKEQKTYH